MDKLEAMRPSTRTQVPALTTSHAESVAVGGAPHDATGGSSEPTASLRQLLKEYGIKMSSQKAYARLAELGIRRTARGARSITGASLRPG